MANEFSNDKDMKSVLSGIIPHCLVFNKNNDHMNYLDLILANMCYKFGEKCWFKFKTFD